MSRRCAAALAAAVVLAAGGCTKPEPGQGGGPGSGARRALTVKGSDTMVQLATAWAQEFMKTHPDISVTVTGGGSGTGIKALINGTADIANSSRPIQEGEKAEIARRGELREFVVAQDALAVIVHPRNPVSELALAQLKDIYTGKTTNWRPVGGPDRKIVLNARETSSGTYVFFQEHVLGEGTPYASTALLQPGTSQIVENVAQDQGGIGYVGLGYVNEQVKPLRIKKDAASPAVEPTAENVLNGSYPLARPLFCYAVGDLSPAAKTYLEWIQGPEGQKIVEQLEFVKLK